MREERAAGTSARNPGEPASRKPHGRAPDVGAISEPRLRSSPRMDLMWPQPAAWIDLMCRLGSSQRAEAGPRSRSAGTAQAKAPHHGTAPIAPQTAARTARRRASCRKLGRTGTSHE